MSHRGILGKWYANPQSPEEAVQLLAQCEARERQRKRHGGNTFTCQLQKMVARFWIGEEVYDHYLMLKPATSRSIHGQVLLELIYGQLLLSRRLREGMTHLDTGFRLATNLLAAGDYLEVMNRHRLLRLLPLSGTASTAEPIDSLLTSARVIERMNQSAQARPIFLHDPKDTYG